MKSIIWVFVASVLLTGCTYIEEGVHRIRHVSDSDKAIDLAKAATNPSIALEIIRKAENQYCDEAFFPLRCKAPEELQLARDEYFIKAVRSGDERSLRNLFEYAGEASSSWTLLQKELKAGVLDRARTSNNPDLLVVAANIYGDDANNLINTSQRISYLKRAWSSGDAPSAGQLAIYYASRGDYENSYFWSLRCILECNRAVDVYRGIEYKIELSDIEKHLSTEQIDIIQGLATEKALTDVELFKKSTKNTKTNTIHPQNLQ